MKKWFLVAIFLVGAGAVALTEHVDFSASQFPLWLAKGLYIGPLVPTPTNNKLNKITAALSTISSYDYPAFGTTGVDGKQGCAQTLGIPLLGAHVGDPCTVSDITGADGGAQEDISVDFTYKVTAPDVVKGKGCAHQSDGGQVDLPDAGYIYRVISNL